MIDLLWAAAIFAACWVLYGALYSGAAWLDIVFDADLGIVVLAFASATVTLVLSTQIPDRLFSSHAAHIVASVAAPVAFLGFAGIFVLVGPVSVQRSVSLTMLLSLERGEPIPDHRVFDFRWQQMAHGGLITADRQLTAKGRRVIRIARAVGRLLNVKPQ